MLWALGASGIKKASKNGPFVCVDRVLRAEIVVVVVAAVVFVAVVVVVVVVVLVVVGVVVAGVVAGGVLVAGGAVFFSFLIPMPFWMPMLVWASPTPSTSFCEKEAVKVGEKKLTVSTRAREHAGST